MGGNADKRVSFVGRTYSKEELLKRERYIKLENSEIPANKIDIEKAIDNAIKKMQAQMGSFPEKTK